MRHVLYYACAILRTYVDHPRRGGACRQACAT
jgi:hypothetical protein